MGNVSSNMSSAQPPPEAPPSVLQLSDPQAERDAAPPTTKSVRRVRSGAPDLPMKRRRKGGRGERKKRDNRKSQLDADYVEDDERQNEAFSAYYREQGIVRADEHDALMSTLATPLPSSFRIVARGAYAAQILSQLRGPLADAFANVPGARAPAPLAWVPGGRAWVVSAPRQMLRRDNVLAPFHRFLVSATELGGVCRQEAVSMVPPLLLDAQPGSAVLDLCAAPGSKTGQIIEALCAGDASESLVRPGLVIANDADIKRCWMLAHQLKRFGASQLVVTHHDAQFFPKVRLFDRVLCDVPCSGDGTLRKAPDIWRRWNTGMGNGLHRMQVSILFRGVELLKPGGRLVYSTCSLNPIENEAVVTAALLKFGPDVVTLVDVSDQLPELKRRPGMTDWKVPNLSGESIPRSSENGKSGIEPVHNAADTQGVTIMTPAIATTDSADHVDGADVNSKTDEQGTTDAADNVERVEVEKSPLPGWYTNVNQVRPRRRRKVVPTMFPPSKEQIESGLCPLERCLRLVPMDQDTGAFFVAVFEKKLTADTGKKRKKQAFVDGQQKTANVDTPVVKVEVTYADVNVDNVDRQEGGDRLVPDTPVGSVRTAPGESVQSMKTPSADASSSKVGTNGGKDGQSGRSASRLITDDPLIGVENLNLNALLEIADFFGLDPEESRNCLMTRGGDASTFKKIVLVSPTVRELLRISLGAAEADGLPAGVRRDRLRVVHAGVTMMERTSRRDCVCPFRIVSDGASTLAQCMRKRVVCIGSTDFARLIQNQTIQISSLSERTARRDMDAIGSGSTLVIDKKDGEIGVIWKARHAISLLIGKMERAALMQRVSALVTAVAEGAQPEATTIKQEQLIVS